MVSTPKRILEKGVQSNPDKAIYIYIYLILWCILLVIKLQMRLKKGKILDAGVATSTSLEEVRPEHDLKHLGTICPLYFL